MSKPTPQKKLSTEDAAAVQSFFSGPRETERLNRFVGWMTASGRECPVIAAEIRNFLKCHLDFFKCHLDSKP